MKLAEYLRELDQPLADGSLPLEQFAERAGTTVGYLRVHVLCARKPASLRYMRRLAAASEGRVSLLDVLRHYGVPPEELKEQAA
ncbi:hypothetical protein [Halomonas elongata]|uniref:Transcriptional regulator n=1 Tax=Halomonas elongata (strain ATCC 33173 / DSM 2581 / NBRC 15536 / NCIMB 2198 / 1H9) TaxID=768066 RepID=A0A1R4A4I6_HALED|nr:hypothetical protein [Halomonas elongata]WBF17841.1 hypothetical protein LM502_17515 [Halomonas elongata]WPU46686.1 hypothetical protein SR933_15765 [Halomonas elongata DSM 2581]SJK83886.1 uncharacterized protein HELO_4197A [Halomonas elongata DSM 2581]